MEEIMLFSVGYVSICCLLFTPLRLSLPDSFSSFPLATKQTMHYDRMFYAIAKCFSSLRKYYLEMSLFPSFDNKCFYIKISWKKSLLAQRANGGSGIRTADKDGFDCCAAVKAISAMKIMAQFIVIVCAILKHISNFICSLFRCQLPEDERSHDLCHIE